MLGTGLLAFRWPFEVLVLAYVVLGPAHYLTQIAWMHRRGYFVGSARGLWLAAPALPLAALELAGGTLAIPVAAAVYAGTLAVALAMVLWPRRRLALAILALAPPVAFALRDVPVFTVGFALLLPTVVHVFVFTGAFLLVGTLRARSATAVLQVLVFGLLAVLLFRMPLHAEAFRPAPLIAEAADAFAPLARLLGRLSPEGHPDRASVAATRFLAFAYAYHYLNWFSKTRVIGWAEMPRRTAALLAATYVATLASYAVDAHLGFAIAFLLSVAHVLLELPLDARTFGKLGAALFGRARAA